MSIQTMIEAIKDKVFLVDGQKFKFKTGKAFINDQIKKFESKNDVALPAAYKEFVTNFATIRGKRPSKLRIRHDPFL